MIKRIQSSVLKWLMLGVVMTGSFQVSASELSEALKKSDAVLLMRHALAPGIGDPAGYKLQDCKTQRNLDATGRAQAQKTGQWLKAQGVGNALVFTSAWCRCKETAENLAFGTPVLEPSLNSFFDDMRQGPQSNVNLQKFIVGREIDAKPKVLLVSQPTWGVDVGAAAQIRGEVQGWRCPATGCSRPCHVLSGRPCPSRASRRR